MNSEAEEWEAKLPERVNNVAYAVRCMFDGLKGSPNQNSATGHWGKFYALPHFFGTDDVYRNEPDSVRDLPTEGEAIAKAILLFEDALREARPLDWFAPPSDSKTTESPGELPEELVKDLVKTYHCNYITVFYSGFEEEV